MRLSLIFTYYKNFSIAETIPRMGILNSKSLKEIQNQSQSYNQQPSETIRKQPRNALV